MPAPWECHVVGRPGHTAHATERDAIAEACRHFQLTHTERSGGCVFLYEWGVPMGVVKKGEEETP